jgi:hypothetical protein
MSIWHSNDQPNRLTHIKCYLATYKAVKQLL